MQNRLPQQTKRGVQRTPPAFHMQWWCKVPLWIWKGKGRGGLWGNERPRRGQLQYSDFHRIGGPRGECEARLLFWHAAHGKVPLAPLTAYTCFRAASSANTADGAPLNTKRVEELRNSTPEHKFMSPENRTCQRCRINSECPPARFDTMSAGTHARGSQPKLSSLYGVATMEPAFGQTNNN